MSRKITCSIPFMECDFIFWPQSCVYTSNELHGWVIAGWFWDMQGGKGRLRPRSWKSNKSCLRSLKMSHSYDKLKNDIFIALIIGSVQAAGMTIWVVCVQAVFRCAPGGLRGQQLTHQPAQLCFLCYCLFCYCFSWAIWPTVLVLCYGFFWSSQIICPGSLLLSEDSTLKGNWTLVSLPDRWSHQIIFHFKKVYSHAMLWIYICFYILDHFWWR